MIQMVNLVQPGTACLLQIWQTLSAESPLNRKSATVKLHLNQRPPNSD
jgi:hypothetical protein